MHYRPNTQATISNAPTLGMPFLDSSRQDPQPSGITPFICKLAKPIALHHTTPPSCSVTLTADNKATLAKVQHILHAGFHEHVPLHYLSNKKMEEAAYTPASLAPGLQILGQQLHLTLVGLEAEGKHDLISELWIECSINLVCPQCEHLNTESDPCPGRDTTNTIADIFAQHFEHICGAANFVS
ncbi:hypothetical protein H0H87_003256 [Tephrocybe sp. NHM501043]|nr:hypothetical protein H0H87_003256 [Tephrocybe sp. NHM501043]